jgi:hypothetical protein
VGLTGLASCGGSDSGGTIFPPKPECQGADVVPYSGDHQLVISKLAIGSKADGFDLDDDGEPDNQLAGLGSLAKGAIEDAFKDFSIIIPLEFFDFASAAADSCVKFAFYLGIIKNDDDSDTKKTAEEGGDCNDKDPAIKPGATEVAGNRKDDDCDGLADESAENVPSTDATDMDGDGKSLADGDCDDTDNAVAPGKAEVCADGKDNDCKSGADWSRDGQGELACSPYAKKPALRLDPVSFENDGAPVIEFNSAETTGAGGALKLNAGPSLFAVSIPVTDGVVLDLKISGATIDAEPSMTADGLTLKNGRLGGVLDAHTLDTIRGLDVEEIGLKKEDSLLDAMFSNPTLGVILNLDKVAVSGGMKCQVPDVDVDRDGLEAFCDTTPMDEVYRVDMCVDGSGKVYKDGENGVTHCTEVKNSRGEFLFADGISVVLTFEAVPAQLVKKN